MQFSTSSNLLETLGTAVGKGFRDGGVFWGSLKRSNQLFLVRSAVC